MNTHQRAKDLLIRRRVEPLSPGDDRWLTSHLAECTYCTAEESSLAAALSALRAAPLDLPRNLASRTQLRVRLRADEMRERSSGTVLLWCIAAVSWALGIATAPWVWRGFEWLGTELHLPRAVWISGVVLWWVFPALVATGVILWQRELRVRGSE
jgi:hypothetical protein